MTLLRDESHAADLFSFIYHSTCLEHINLYTMSHPQYFQYKGNGEFHAKNFHYSQAVRVGDIIECSGQGEGDLVKQRPS